MSAILSRKRLPLVAGMLLLLSGTVSSLAATPRPDIRDVQIALYIRRAFLADPELGHLNLGVTVQLGEASIWGDVPSYAVAERALRLAGTIKGVYSVRNDLHVTGVPPQQTLQELIEGLAGVAPRIDLPAPPEPRPESGSGLRPLILPGVPEPQQVVNARPDVPALEPEKPLLPARHVFAGVTLLPPVPVAATSLTSPPVVLLAPRGASGLPDLRADVERIRKGDTRFRDVRAEVSDGRVTLSGRVREREDLMELGRALSRLSGVVHVDLREVVTSR